MHVNIHGALFSENIEYNALSLMFELYVEFALVMRIRVQSWHFLFFIRVQTGTRLAFFPEGCFMCSLSKLDRGVCSPWRQKHDISNME